MVGAINLDNVEDAGAGERAAYFRRLAEQGDAEAQMILGSHYALGKGVPLDLEEAARWFRKAADAGNVQAMACLGQYYAQKNPPDTKQAVKWYQAAADRGHDTAAQSLRELEGRGRGRINTASAAPRAGLSTVGTWLGGSLIAIGVFSLFIPPKPKPPPSSTPAFIVTRPGVSMTIKSCLIGKPTVRTNLPEGTVIRLDIANPIDDYHVFAYSEIGGKLYKGQVVYSSLSPNHEFKDAAPTDQAPPDPLTAPTELCMASSDEGGN